MPETPSSGSVESAEQLLNSLLSGAKTDIPDTPHREHIPKEDIAITVVDDLALIPRGDNSYSEPWSQYPDESSTNYERFLYYRDMGPSRTLEQTAQHFDLARGDSLPSKKYDWKTRVAAWDAHLDRVYRLKLQESLKEMANRHATQIVDGLEAMMLPFSVIKERLASDPDFLSGLTETSAKVLIDLAVKTGKIIPAFMAAERLARGLPAETTKVEGEIRHVHEFTNPDQLAEIAAILERNNAFAFSRGAGSIIEIDDAEVVGEVYDYDPDPQAGGFSSS